MYVLVVFRILIKRKANKKQKQKSLQYHKHKQTNKKSTKYYFSFRFDNFLSAFAAAFLKPCAAAHRSNKKKLFLISLVLVVLAEETSTT